MIERIKQFTRMDLLRLSSTSFCLSLFFCVSEE